MEIKTKSSIYEFNNTTFSTVTVESEFKVKLKNSFPLIFVFLIVNPFNENEFTYPI